MWFEGVISDTVAIVFAVEFSYTVSIILLLCKYILILFNVNIFKYKIIYINIMIFLIAFIIINIFYFIYKHYDYEFKTQGLRIINDNEYDIEVSHNVMLYLFLIYVMLFLINITMFIICGIPITLINLIETVLTT